MQSTPRKFGNVKTIAIVPMKPLDQAKTRLAGALLPEQRAGLTLEMLHHVLRVLTGSGMADLTVVVGPSAEGLSLPSSVLYLRQTTPGLNHALGQGKEWAIARGADAIMVVLADLPLLKTDDIVRIHELGQAPHTVVLAPDRHNMGTNIMFAHPASIGRFAFGTESYPKHTKLYEEAGLRVETYSSAGTALDMDTQDDLLLLQQGALAQAK